MIDDLRITVLADNTVRASNLLAEHGLAFWIEADGRRILFDTGQGKVLSHNAKQLQIPLGAAEAIAISHGHFDHTGGLKELLELDGEASLYLHPAALEMARRLLTECYEDSYENFIGHFLAAQHRAINDEMFQKTLAKVSN